MTIIVQKFGGTSVADTERIARVATHVKREVNLGNSVVVIVSAMAGVTNQLVSYVSEFSDLSSHAACMEYDTVVSAGEQITSGLLALALQKEGIPARSFLGWQIPLETNFVHSSARIKDIGGDCLTKTLVEGKVAVVAGFQGVCNNRITTLGRGGSDTSAVAIAAALNADRCDIYTDVDGVYTTDPRIVKEAKKLDKITFEEMLEMASLGAKVLQKRSVEMAMKHNVTLRVLSTFDNKITDNSGTLLVNEEDIMEQHKVTGIAYSKDEARITVTKVPDSPGVAAMLFGALSDANINVDMIVQNVSDDGTTDMTFTISRADLDKAVFIIEEIKGKVAYESLHTDSKVVKISAVGIGMKSHAGVASDMFRVLSEKGINILVISTSEIKISVLIEEEYMELAVRALHNFFELEE